MRVLYTEYRGASSTFGKPASPRCVLPALLPLYSDHLEVFRQPDTHAIFHRKKNGIAKSLIALSHLTSIGWPALFAADLGNAPRVYFILKTGAETTSLLPAVLCVIWPTLDSPTVFSREDGLLWVLCPIFGFDRNAESPATNVEEYKPNPILAVPFIGPFYFDPNLSIATGLTVRNVDTANTFLFAAISPPTLVAFKMLPRYCLLLLVPFLPVLLFSVLLLPVLLLPVLLLPALLLPALLLPVLLLPALSMLLLSQALQWILLTSPNRLLPALSLPVSRLLSRSSLFLIVASFSGYGLASVWESSVASLLPRRHIFTFVGPRNHLGHSLPVSWVFVGWMATASHRSWPKQEASLILHV